MAAMVTGIEKLDMIMICYPGPNDESICRQWHASEELKSNGGTVSDLAVKPASYRRQGILEYNTQHYILVQMVTSMKGSAWIWI
ncbi:hypothetical protein ACHAW6_003906 [Cyclotella cf. meneghiniana]